MPTLHSVTQTTKDVLKWGGLGLGSIIFFIFLVRGTQMLYKMLNPPKPPPPNVKFGKLPLVNFPNRHNHNLTYKIDTVSGTLPYFSDRIKVYKMLHNQPTLLDLQHTIDRVAKIDFVTSPKQLSEDEYQWGSFPSYNDPFSRTLTMNIVSNFFTMTSDYVTSASVLATLGLPNESGSIQKVTEFLNNLGLLPLDLDTTKTKTELYTLKDSTLIPVQSIGNTQIIRVDLFQKNVDDTPIYYPKPPYSTVNFLVAGGTFGQGTVLEANYSYQFPSLDSGVYPIKTSLEAYDELQKGDAYIAANYQANKEIVIKSVSLGYYIGDLEQDYLMPIIVFKGEDDSFVAYVSAIKDDWIK